MTKTALIPYTIAIDTAANLLAACTPDNNRAALDREIAEYRANSTPGHQEAMQIYHGCILTDEPDDGDEVVWQGHHGGWLSDEDGRTYDCAVLRPDRTMAKFQAVTLDAEGQEHVLHTFTGPNADAAYAAAEQLCANVRALAGNPPAFVREIDDANGSAK